MKFAAVSLRSWLVILPFVGSLATAKPALSQSITPAPDGTGTTVTTQGNTFNIQGGSLSRDGANLFHSFQKFGLSSGETANFLTLPDIRNILGRVVGGDASYINGLIQVSGGNSNLFLMNPAGILFGPNASLNVPASFTATTATGIGFGSGWFNAVGSNDYNVLVGTPSAFNFAVSQPGAIVNEGNLSLTSGSSLTLLGGTVINTGTLTSPGGNITIAAVPGDSAVRISQEGHLLSLDIEPAALTGAEVPAVLQPLSLPQLLTGRPDFGHASALSVSETGEVSLTGSGVTIPASGGIAAGNIDTSSESGDGGAIALNATSDIITGSLRTAAGGTGTGGNIEIVSSAGGIDTAGGKLDSSSRQGNGGSVTLTASGDIKTGDISSSYSWGTGNGGNIALNSSAGGIDTASGWLFSNSSQGNGGSVTLTAFGDIKTGNIQSYSNGTGNGGHITLNSSAGGIDTHNGYYSKLDSYSAQGNGGSVTLTASGDIKTGDIKSFSWGTGNGGNIALNSSAGGIDTTLGTLSSSSAQENGGSVTLTASGDIKTGGISSDTNGTGTGGDISLNSNAGGIDTAGAKLDSGSFQGNGGSVTLTASGDIKTGGISSYTNGTGTGGDISLTSRAGGINTTFGSQNTLGKLDSSSKQGNGGSLTLTASGIIYTGNLNSSGLLRGGDITITSQLNDIINGGFLDSSSGQGTPGQIALNAFAGSISTGNLNGARNVTIVGGGFDEPIGASADASVTSDADKINTRSGNVTLGAHNDITVNEPIKTNSITSLELNAGRSININADIDTSGGNGNITLRGNNNGANPNYRESGPGSVTMAPGTALSAGSGNIVIELGRLGQVGNITLSNINTTGALTVNATTGNILRSSADSLITARSAFFQTSTLGTGGIGLPAEPLRISVSNLEANAGSGGAFFDSPERGVTLGGATDQPLGIVIAGGGEVSLRAAGDIAIAETVSTASALSGNAGKIALNSTAGAINASATLNSSAAQGNGGSVMLTASGDIKTGGIQSSSNGTGNGGDIALTSSAGAINTTGGELSSYSSQGNGGSVTLTAFGDIKTGEIGSYSNVTGSGGDITLNSSAGGIDTTSDWLYSYSFQGNGGSVTLTAFGDIKTGGIESYSYDTGSGGDITLNSSAGAINTTGGKLSSYSFQGNGGSVTLTASGDIKTGGIESYSYGTGSGGNITLNSSAGGIDTTSGWLSSNSSQGNGGSVTLTAFGDIKTSNISSYSNGTGNGGNITLNSSAGGIDTADSMLSSYSSQGNGGSVTLTASGDIKTGQIESMAGFKHEWVCPNSCQSQFIPVTGSTGTGGDITIQSSNGGVDTSTGSLNTMSSGGAAGDVTINAAGHVEIASIRSDGFLQGGNLSIRSDSLNSINVGGNLDTYSTSGTAGNITLSSPGIIALTGDITSYGSTESGDITVTSDSNNVTTNAITTQAGNGPSGNISINGNNIAAGNLDSIGSTGAGNIEVRAGNSVTTLNIQSRTDEGDSGNIDVIAPADINTGDQTTSTGDGNSGDITNTAGNNITAGNQTASATNGNTGNITNSAGSNVTAGNQTTSATNGNSGNITNTALRNVTAGNQTTSATNGNSGNIDNSAGGNVTAANQTTSATNGNSGNITNTAGGNVTAGNQTTSVTNGNSGNITNSAGGNITTGLQTTSATGGTAGEITNTAGGSITTGNLPPTGINGSGNITVTSASGPINTGQVRTDTGIVRIQVSSDSSINPNISSRPTPTPDNNNTTFSNSAQQILTSLNVSSSSPLAVNSAEAIAKLEQTREWEFANYFGEDISNQLTTTESIREALSTIASQTGYRSAIIYITALPDELELVVFPPEGQPIRKTVPAASREELLKVVADFRNKVTNPIYRHSTGYLPPAQQLYQWLIAPIEPELQAAKIDTLLFSMDAGLRGLPVAALHDGKQFLVEKYSLALIPSVSLMDTRYQPLQGKQVLAMGASQFPEQLPLPAVPVELDEITQKLWQGKAFLNQDFTRDNLMGLRNSYPYSIIHLATHAEFLPGAAKDSYIQLWDDKLGLDQMRNLRLNNPPVELLVLSACRTAVGDEKAELGFAGFAVAAGVKTAVASLWYVSDAGTLGLMTEFYSHLSDAKIKAEALRQAQLAMIREQVRMEGGELRNSNSRAGVPLPAELLKEGYHNLKHPYYWSGFTMIGSPW